MKSFNEFKSSLNQSKKLVFFTGAGISTESGVPDFRSPGGIWTRYQPVPYQDFLASHESRVQYWKMKKETHELYKDVQPNIGHKAIAQFEKSNQLLGVITQNIDGLHQLGGVSEEKIIELHGTDRKISCLSCGKDFDAETIFQKFKNAFDPPICDQCQGYLKSATISFGQLMPVQEMQQAQEWTMEADVFIVLGSSLQVQPAASFPAIAKRYGACLAIINNDPTPLDDIADFFHRGSIGDFFKSLME